MGEKRYTLVVAVAILCIALTATATADFYACGDADGSGSVNISDAIYLLSYIFGSHLEPLDVGGGDYNSDGRLNMTDCVYLIGYIFGGGPAPCAGTVIDIDGNVYQTIRIGDQWWMADNLQVTRYRNGDPIPNVTGIEAWTDLTTGAYCDYDNDEGNVATYGRLYNWFAVHDSRNIAPAGWHVPTDAEWKQLELYLGMSQAEADSMFWRGTNEGGRLKEAGTTHWYPPNTGGTNESGFTALPGGCRLDAPIDFNNLRFATWIWCSTESDSYNAWYRNLAYSMSGIARAWIYKRSGLSVRCVRD